VVGGEHDPPAVGTDPAVGDLPGFDELAQARLRHAEFGGGLFQRHVAVSAIWSRKLVSSGNGILAASPRIRWCMGVSQNIVSC
jgi:hypothetical protein